MELLTRSLNMRQAKSVWSPSSLEISSLLKLRTVIRPRFFRIRLRCWNWFTGAPTVPSSWLEGLSLLYGVEELVPRLPVLDGVNVEALHLTEDVLHHYLEAVEASCLWNIDLYMYNHNVTNDDILNHSKFTFKHFPVFLVWLFWGWSPVLDTLW